MREWGYKDFLAGARWRLRHVMNGTRIKEREMGFGEEV
jgi:hypothetical protein